MEPVTLAWTGFRGFRTRTEFQLPKLTLLIGKNNVGKTSTYAPLLMLRQTLDAHSPKTALLGRGELIDAGSFRDYATDHNVEQMIEFEISIPGKPDVSVYRSETRHRLAKFEVGFRSHDGTAPYLARQRIEDEAGTALASRTRQRPDDAFTLKSELLPTRAAQGRPLREMTELRRALREEQPRGFLFDGFSALMIPREVRRNPERWVKVQDWYNAASDLYEIQQSANMHLHMFLRGISYLGPLRSLPLRTYRLGAEAPIEVGHTGEHAPELLFRRQGGDAQAIVDRWLKTLGYGKLSFTSLGEEYFQMHLQQGSRPSVNIADSGMGFSQVLPLLMQTALAREGETVIAQQPEIHLNPAQQSLVTDFLVERAAANVRVVIETHSEHVLLRLRRRVAEGELNAKDVAIYFVEGVPGGTALRRIELGELGEIDRSDWPDGFFEGQLKDSFALAAEQVRKRAAE